MPGCAVEDSAASSSRRRAGVLWCDGTEYPIRAGDAVLVPPGAEHDFENTGDVTLARLGCPAELGAVACAKLQAQRRGASRC